MRTEPGEWGVWCKWGDAATGFGLGENWLTEYIVQFVISPDEKSCLYWGGIPFHTVSRGAHQPCRQIAR